MKVEGSVALVTGANRGLGHAFTRALLERGAAKVYACARNAATVTADQVVPVELDVTDHVAVAAAAARLLDVNVIVNNAGVATAGRPLTVPLEHARGDMEVNYLGPLAMAQSFAPVLSSNGGGALINILSVLSWVTVPQISAYAASKAAAWSMTNALRQQLRQQNTLVVAVHADSIDTDMTKGLERAKSDPADVAQAVLRAVENGVEEVLFDEYTRKVKASLHDDLRLLYS
ncbi:SDR family oxidoreductase [Actinocrispum wychmicini]|uniref:SDR family oxidoreductase n=1 Tax=Actinocrispum wychmicini TaxID=1213861 RepID=UPI00104E4646|nr:SDR family oxidoreductase [Actinocrispum wychmicini]